MKKILSGACVLAMIMFAGACSKTSVDAPASSADSVAVSTAVSNGNWKVSLFRQRTEDKTGKLAGYVFVFSANGTLLIKDDKGVETSGTWKYSPAVTYYGSTSKAAVVINAGNKNPLDDISKTWNVVSVSNTKLSFIYPEIAEDKHLEFSKQ